MAIWHFGNEWYAPNNYASLSYRISRLRRVIIFHFHREIPPLVKKDPVGISKVTREIATTEFWKSVKSYYGLMANRQFPNQALFVTLTGNPPPNNIGREKTRSLIPPHRALRKSTG